MNSHSEDSFLNLMRPHTEPAALLARLRPAYEALRPYAPASVGPAAPPGPERALAFEARWPDGRTLLVLTQEHPSARLDSQLTLTQQGITKSSVLTAHSRLAAAVLTCLGPLPGAGLPGR